MNPTEQNKLMPYLQAGVALLIVVNVFAIMYLVIFKPPGDDAKEIIVPMIEVLKNIMLLLVGFLFGTSVSSAKKDDQNAALVAQVVPTNSPPPAPPPVAPAPAPEPIAPAPSPAQVKHEEAEPVPPEVAATK